jgi:plasmid stabilization system protein ParE
MATVVYSPLALTQLERLAGAAAPATLEAIRSAVEPLAAHPFLGARVAGDLRALVVSYGNSGCLALYRYGLTRDEVRILAVGTQRELGFSP